MNWKRLWRLCFAWSKKSREHVRRSEAQLNRKRVRKEA